MTDSAPGFGSNRETEEAQLWGSGPDNQHQRFHAKGLIVSTVTDTGNTGYTTTLRAGNVLGVRDSTGLQYLYDADATNGDQKVCGVLEKYLYMGDRDGTVEDKHPKVLIGGLIKSVDDLVNEDKAALAVLLRRGFHLMTLDPHGSYFGRHWKARYFKAADYTIVDGDHGCKFVAITGAVNFTLPTLATVGPGFQVMIYNAVDADMVITAAANTIIYGDAGGALSTTLTFSTANKKMGGQAVMHSDYGTDGTTLQWYAEGVVGATSA